MKTCENCLEENSHIDSISICPKCLEVLNFKMEFLLLENRFLKHLLMKEVRENGN